MQLEKFYSIKFALLIMQIQNIISTSWLHPITYSQEIEDQFSFIRTCYCLALRTFNYFILEKAKKLQHVCITNYYPSLVFNRIYIYLLGFIIQDLIKTHHYSKISAFLWVVILTRVRLPTFGSPQTPRKRDHTGRCCCCCITIFLGVRSVHGHPTFQRGSATVIGF